ncbi:hypothetical protein VNI00_011960 [Paramarasmius palmivorus]|uniref:DUF6589 domain-containing protein n=1 Tax=Paramarasmius palmivorus TaxID=297713 RepID=A0AAW0C911_9AGAR
MKEVCLLLPQCSWELTYDNVEIMKKVYSQRIANLKQFNSRTVCTVYVRPSAVPLSATANRNLQEKQSEGIKSPLTSLDVFELAQRAQPLIKDRAVHVILQYLLDSPNFDIKKYRHKGSPLLQPPPRHRGLPTGPEQVTQQYLLGTVKSAEASYEDHIQLIPEWLRQIGMGDNSTKQNIGWNKVLFFMGDQLTVSWLCGLYQQRAEDINSFEHLDWLIALFGWFHFAMTAANSYHNHKVQTKGIFHHHLDKGLHHVTEAHILECWKEEAKVDDLAELRTKPPEALHCLAEQVYEKHASSEALNLMDSLPKEHQDALKRQHTMFLRDILPYIILWQSIRSSDIGMMESLLPFFFFRFVGGSNGNYALECIELLQGLHREWTTEIAEYVRLNCWVMTSTGRSNSFVPFDQVQEHNVKDIKVTYHSQGPNIDWEYMKKLHPAIPVIHSVTDHIEEQFETYTRGKHHTVPKKDEDIKRLQQSYNTEHSHQDGRKLKDDVAKDYMIVGAEKVLYGNWLQ